MSEIEMFHVGENDKGEALYNLRYIKGGKSLPTPSMTKAEALAKINGTEVVEPIVVSEDEVVVKFVLAFVTVESDYENSWHRAR